jgi:hypothetical protein
MIQLSIQRGSVGISRLSSSLEDSTLSFQ